MLTALWARSSRELSRGIPTLLRLAISGTLESTYCYASKSLRCSSAGTPSSGSTPRVTCIVHLLRQAARTSRPLASRSAAVHTWPLGWQEGRVDCTVWPIFNEHVTSPGGATAHYSLLQYCRVSACWSVRPSFGRSHPAAISAALDRHLLS